MTRLADPVSNGWGFWQAWENGTWEPKTHAVIDLFVDGGTYVDIGAWVGPTVLWAARNASRVVAVEPDPTAFDMLWSNVKGAENQHGQHVVECCNLAISDHDGETTIDIKGDSQSRSDDGGVPIRCVTVETLFTERMIRRVDLIKIDVEGAEARILPQAAPFLRDVGVPLHVSTHPWDPLDWSCLDGWHRVQLGDDEWLVLP